MSKLSTDSPPQYEPHSEGQDNILITVIQNEKRLRKLDRKMEDLYPRVEKNLDSLIEGDLRSPKSLKFMLQSNRLFDEMRDLFEEKANIIEEGISHGQKELYDAMEKLSDSELDRVFASSKLGTTSLGLPELTWNHKSNTNGHGNFKCKSSRARKFFHAIQRAWKYLKGQPV